MSAEDLAPGMAVLVNGRPCPVLRAEPEVDGVWVDLQVGGMDVPARYPYGTRVEVAR